MAVGKAFVVEAQQVEHRRVEIVNVNRVSDGLEV